MCLNTKPPTLLEQRETLVNEIQNSAPEHFSFRHEETEQISDQQESLFAQISQLKSKVMRKLQSQTIRKLEKHQESSRDMSEQQAHFEEQVSCLKQVNSGLKHKLEQFELQNHQLQSRAE